MRVVMALLVFVLCSFNCIAQTEIPENLLQTWYLYYFTMPGEGEIMLNTLDISQGPSFTINDDYTITGNTFCNDFSGLFDYTPYMGPFDEFDIFNPYDISITTNNCGTEEAYESRVYDAFINGEEGEILHLDEEYFVVQFPSSGYQGYRNTPVLGLHTQQMKQTKIFPNPVSETLHIVSNKIPLTGIQIVSLQGKVLFTQSDNLQEINISHLASGIYFIKVVSEVGSNTLKFIKD